MLGTTKFAIGCAIVWVALILYGQSIVPDESSFAYLSVETQSSIKAKAQVLQMVSSLAFLGIAGGTILTVLTNKERKVIQEIKERKARAAREAEESETTDQKNV